MQTASDQRARVSWTYTCVLMQCVSMEHMCIPLYMRVNGCVRLMELCCALVACAYMCPCTCMSLCFSMSNASTPHALMTLAQHVAHARAQVYTHVAAVHVRASALSASDERGTPASKHGTNTSHTRFQIWTVTPWMRPVHVYHFQVIMIVYGFVLLFSGDNSLPCLLHASPFILIHPHPTHRVCRARHPLGTQSISIYFLNTYQSNSDNNEIDILSMLITMHSKKLKDVRSNNA